MMTNTNAKLAVSSVILAAVLSGCSQQVIGDSQVVNGSSQQAYGGSKVDSVSQKPVEKAKPVIQNRAPVKKVTPIKRATVSRPKPTHSIRRNNMNLPPAKPGQCFAKVKLNASYKTQSRRILVSKAVNKRVLVRAPQYRFVNKRIEVKKAFYKTQTIPAQYRTNIKRVMVKPAHDIWKKGHGAITRIDNMTGEIMCRVTVPAVYKNVSQRVLVHPAKTIRTLVPAVYKTVKEKKLIAPALYKSINTPARYKTQNYRVKTGGARYVWRAVLCKTNAPKGYKKAVIQHKPVSRTAKTSKYRKNTAISYNDYMLVMNAGKKSAKPAAKKSAKKVVASNNKRVTKSFKTKKKVTHLYKIKKATTKMAPKVVAPAVKKVGKQSKSATKKSIVYGIQKALKAKGFDPGVQDGKMGAGTAAALKAFQSSRGLPVGQLSKDTFRALGLIR